MLMQGINAWGYESGAQPQAQVQDYLATTYYKTYHGCLRWAKVVRGSSLYKGWVLCYPDGKPITYADNNQPGKIIVSASGTYMTV